MEKGVGAVAGEAAVARALAATLKLRSRPDGYFAGEVRSAVAGRHRTREESFEIREVQQIFFDVTCRFFLTRFWMHIDSDN